MRRLLMMSGTRKPLLLAPWSTRPLSFVNPPLIAQHACRAVAGAELAMAGRVFQRQRVRHAIAELHRVGPEVHTGRTGVTRGTDVEVGVGTTVGEDIEERLAATDREARELNERAIPVGQAVVRRTGVAGRGARTNEARRRLVPAGADVRPQGAVVGLGACIQRHDGASRPVDVVGVDPVKLGLRESAAGAKGLAARAPLIRSAHEYTRRPSGRYRCPGCSRSLHRTGCRP